MPEKLDTTIILSLLAKADTVWFSRLQRQSSPMNYREHLEFTAKYIVDNYNKEAKK